MAPDKTTIPILLVDDNEIDIELVRRALKRANISNPFHVAFDGVEALDMLRGHAQNRRLAQPCIILVDLNMPRMDGLEFLQELRKDDTLKNKIVFILTTSADNEDKRKAYEMNVAGYILKENLTLLTEMLDYYCRVNEFIYQ